MRNLFRELLFVIVATLAVASCVDREQGSAAGEVAAPGDAAPVPLNAVDIDPLTSDHLAEVLASNRGQVVLVNLWATWCAPCLEEIPYLLKLESELGPRGLQLIGISLDDPAATDQIREFRDEWFPGFRTYHTADTDWYKLIELLDSNWPGVLPTSFVLDRAGNVVDMLTGGKEYAAFEAAVTPHL